MRKLIIPIVLVLSVLCIFSVSATTILVSPLASSTLCLNAPINISTDAHGGADFNCTLYAKSVSTANSSWVIVQYQIVNTSSGNATLPAVNFSVLEDSNDYVLNATCQNITGILETGDTNIGITIDCTSPTAPTLSPTTNTLVTSSGSQTFTGTVTDSETTSCSYVIGRGGLSTTSADTTTGTGTYSGSSCTFTKTFTDQNDNGQWYWQITASDGTNSSSTTALLQVQIAPSGGYDESEDITQTTIIEKLAENKELWIVLGIVVGIVVLYLIFRK